LHHCEGHAHTAAREFLEEVELLAQKATAERPVQMASDSTSTENTVRSLAQFHSDPRYDSDLHRADMAWSVHAASRGLTGEQIRHEILHARDLSKKGGPARQFDYAKRTASKAVKTVLR
jgi:hypothetical protein